MPNLIEQFLQEPERPDPPKDIAPMARLNYRSIQQKRQNHRAYQPFDHASQRPAGPYQDWEGLNRATGGGVICEWENTLQPVGEATYIAAQRKTSQSMSAFMDIAENDVTAQPK